MKSSFFLLIFLVITVLKGYAQNSSQNQTKASDIKVGAPCEGCEAVYESPAPFEKLNATATLPDYDEKGAKIGISGIVYQADGKTPAPNVIIYVYHTDQTGRYTPGKNATGWEKRHGHIRGWMKTDKNGFYKFYTLRPASYPNSIIPQHIHIIIKEPGKTEYWIDEYLFDDDRFLTTSERNKQQKRGGNGIIKLISQSNGIARGTRNIILGMNVPGYPL